MSTATALSGLALRLHLVELFLPASATPAAAIQAARDAYSFIEPPPLSVVEIGSPITIDWPAMRKRKIKPDIHPGPAPQPEPEPEPPAPTPIDLGQLERLYAAGLPQPLIAERLNTTHLAVRKALEAAPDIKVRWPRDRAGTPTRPPYSLDAVWPPPDGWAPQTPPASSRRQRFAGYAAQGLSEADIAQAEGIKVNSVSAAMSTYQLTSRWRQAQIQRRPSEIEEPRRRTQQPDREILGPLCRAGASREDIAKELGCAVNSIHMRVAQAGLSAIWEDALAAQQAACPKPALPPVEAAVWPSPERPAAIDAAAVPVTRAPPKAWEHPGGPVDVDTVIACLRHAGDTVIAIGTNMWMLNGEGAGAKHLLDRVNGQRKRLRDPRFGPFQLAKG